MSENKNLQRDLMTLAGKYHITNLLFLCEEKNPTTNELSNRSIAIQSEPEKEKSIHLFAELMENCIRNSKTMQKITNHLNNHSIENLIAESELKKRQKRAD